MKICWDNLENLRYNEKTGKWCKGRNKYFYKESCKTCGESFLSNRKNGLFCCSECSLRYHKGTNHHMYGKHHTDESIERNRLSNIGKHHSEETKKKMSEMRKGENHHMYGKHHSEETKKKLSEANKGKTGRKHTEETKKKIKDTKKRKPYRHSSEVRKYLSEIKSNGYTSKGIPLYDTYAHQIEWCEEVRRNPKDSNILEVKCTYCGKWYIPKIDDVIHRIQVLKGQLCGEYRLYCSDACKHACPIYGKKPEQLIREDALRAGRLSWLELNREVQPKLRQMVLKRDEYKCVKCGSTGPLHCHHVLPTAIEPLLSADIDNCITLCEQCHKEAHNQDGCRYNEIRVGVC